MDIPRVTSYLFVVGLILSVVSGAAVGALGIVQASQTYLLISVVFVVIGLTIGFFMTATKKVEEEIYVLLVATVALMIASTMNVFAGLNQVGIPLGNMLDSIVGFIAVFGGTTLIVLSIRTITHFHVSRLQAGSK